MEGKAVQAWGGEQEGGDGGAGRDALEDSFQREASGECVGGEIGASGTEKLTVNAKLLISLYLVIVPTQLLLKARDQVYLPHSQPSQNRCLVCSEIFLWLGSSNQIVSHRSLN